MFDLAEKTHVSTHEQTMGRLVWLLCRWTIAISREFDKHGVNCLHVRSFRLPCWCLVHYYPTILLHVYLQGTVCWNILWLPYICWRNNAEVMWLSCHVKCAPWWSLWGESGNPCKPHIRWQRYHSLYAREMFQYTWRAPKRVSVVSYLRGWKNIPSNL